MRTSYDRTTDSLYLELRPLPARRTVEMEEDVLVDLAEDGEPVGYGIQNASERRELVARLLLKQSPEAAS